LVWQQEPVQLPELIFDYLKQRCSKEEPLGEPFKQGEIL
jgi:hypothetical protein